MRPTTDGRVNGLQLGIDAFQYGTENGGYHDVGFYVGHTNGNERVHGFASGVENKSVDRLHPKTTYAALYWTYTAPTGFYADTVIQYSWYDGHATSAAGKRIDIGGSGVLASVEVGYPLRVSSNWVLEPQAQLIGQGTEIDPMEISNAVVTQHNRGTVTGRLGVRLKGRYENSSLGSIQPYIRANLWKGFASQDRTTFHTAVANTTIITNTSSLWGEGGAGLTWSLNSKVSIYGEADYRFTLIMMRV